MGYTKTGQVDSMFYPAVSVAVDYRYSPRKWLDTLKATKGGSDLFTQYLTFNAGGQITRQQSQQGGSYPLIQDYTYDGISQLTEWKKQYGGIYGWTRELYAYDPVGNRDSLTYIANGWSTPYPKDYYDNGRGSSVPGVGPNQLLKVTQPSGDYTEYDYDRNGSMTTRQQYTSTNVLTKEERFGYSSWRNLPWSYEREDPTITVGPNVWEYRYRYNAMGEREQKREWLTPAGDVTAPGYEWTYYLLGGSKEQMSVWKGMQTSESGFCGDTGTGSNVYLYPVEYLSYGGYAASLIARPSGTVEYRIADHLGSNRVVLDNTGTVLSTTDYAPFGKPVAGSEDRKSWIDKETDIENDLGNLGVRAYDDNLGRFTSVDPLWEKYRSWSPYQYSMNLPIVQKDPTGKTVEPECATEEQEVMIEILINEIISWNSPVANDILNRALGTDSEIKVYVFSSPQLETETTSKLSSTVLENVWNDHSRVGLTQRIEDRTEAESSVMLNGGVMKETVFLDDEGKLFEYSQMPLALLDELCHSVMCDTDEDEDHRFLFTTLLNELNSGKISVGKGVETQIRKRAEKYVE
ncbi:MAG: RHS repeat-associated core domain-containing protein [Candidatus Kapaibacterium sp.]|nr:hypothetical protein [Ignavibacteria bacterium]